MLVRDPGIAGGILLERLFDVSDLPAVDVDIGLDRLISEIGFAPFHIASQRFEFFADLRFESYSHRCALAHAGSSPVRSNTT